MQPQSTGSLALLIRPDIDRKKTMVPYGWSALHFSTSDNAMVNNSQKESETCGKSPHCPVGSTYIALLT